MALIGINAQGLTHPFPCGINTYLINLLSAFGKLDQENEFLLFASDRIHLDSPGKNMRILLGKKLGLFSYFGFSRLFNVNQCDVAFIPKETVPLLIDKPVVITVYDLFFIKMYKKFKRQIKFSTKLHYELAKLTSFKKAAKLCAISESCKRDLIETCSIDPEKIVVTHLSYDPAYFFPRTREEIEAVKQKYQISQPYFLNISSVFWERKNVMGVLKAFKMLQEAGFPHTLIMVGNIGPSYKQMQSYIHQHHLNVKCLFSIPVDALAILLSGAEALVFPSFHEGFGLPIIEAMAVGCPVITSNVSAMPEVAGEAALLVDPYQCDEIYLAMKKIIEAPSLIAQLKTLGFQQAKKFSWLNTAQQTLNALYSV